MRSSKYDVSIFGLESTKGFTLIELLIVVAIIGILAAIAIPNFLQAQTRAKVSRTQADLRSVSLAVETYRVDQGDYPWYSICMPNPRQLYADVNNPFIGYTPRSLTTPVEYLSSLPKEAFQNAPYQFNPNPLGLYFYDCEGNFEFRSGNNESWNHLGGNVYKYALVGIGPDRITYVSSSAYGATFNITEPWQDRAYFTGCAYYYDPTNGTISYGDIILSGPGGGFGCENRHKL